jgi:hypothetical protein
MLVGLIVTAAFCLLSLYLIQYPFYRFDARNSSPYLALLLLMLCGVAVVLVYGGIVLLNKRFKWYSGVEMAKVVAGSSLIFSLLMLLVFTKIPIPYSWIPSGNEMAFGFGELLIQIFSMVPAIVIAGICVVYIVIKSKR